MKRMFSILIAAAAMLVPSAAVAQFAGVTSGPNTNTACQSAPALYFDQQNSVLSTCGTTHIASVNQKAMATFSAQTAVTTVTTAQTMASLALNANMQNVAGRTLRICGYGIYTSPGTTTPTLTFQITEGGVTPVAITTAGVSSTASTNMPFNFCFDLTTVATGTSGTLEAHGAVSCNITANTPAAAQATYQDTNTAVSSAINLFNANTLAVQVAASSTITSVQLRQLTIELIS